MGRMGILCGLYPNTGGLTFLSLYYCTVEMGRLVRIINGSACESGEKF